MIRALPPVPIVLGQQSAAVVFQKRRRGRRDERHGQRRWSRYGGCHVRCGGITATPTAAGGAAVLNGQQVALPLPWAPLQPGDQVETVTGGIQTGDQWKNIMWRGIAGHHWVDEAEEAALYGLLSAGRG